MSNKNVTAEAIMKTITDKLNAKPEAAKNWGQSMNLVFSDVGYGYWIKFAMDGTVERVEKGNALALKKKGAVATVTTTTDTLQAILDGIIQAMSAMYSGAIKVDGPIDAVMKLSPAFI
jgi:putative sterol carrier protein